MVIWVKLSESEILNTFNKRKVELNNLDKLLNLDKRYLSFLSTYNDIEVIPDIEIFGYETALKENHYLESNFPEVHLLVWIIGRSGQGDEWFIEKASNNILFYDHTQGEYSNIEKFLNFNIVFIDFLQMAFLYQQLENIFDKEKEVSQQEIISFKEKINSIHSQLYDNYPFKYF